MSEDYIFTIAADHACLEGHFPEMPVVPGVVILDRVARAVACSHSAHMTRIVRCKFLAGLAPDTRCTVSLETLDGQRFAFVCRTQGELIAQGIVEWTPLDNG